MMLGRGETKFTKGDTVQVWDWAGFHVDDQLPQHGKTGVIVRKTRQNLFTVAIDGEGMVAIHTDWLRKS
jgi:hypothetical protein